MALWASLLQLVGGMAWGSSKPTWFFFSPRRQGCATVLIGDVVFVPLNWLSLGREQSEIEKQVGWGEGTWDMSYLYSISISRSR